VFLETLSRTWRAKGGVSHALLIVQVNHIDPKALEAGVAALPHVGRVAPDAEPFMISGPL
jgi:hypothetical protein